MSRTPLSLIIYYLDYLFNYIIKIYGNKIEHQLKNKNLFEIVITLNKKKNSCSLFLNQSNIEGLNKKNY
jgi:hypothetical protein